ncbi:MAG: nascent polypeptide-associated complex protein [archaeon]|jgi:nascent polypeptide-associated complex subunit alpha|nr:nascent polypeptide-associated complex protein [archaeon]MDD2477981.1 nascent polypeptide-associated complex protein [Candidatus ainarchaeum sp.]MDD3084926.1 nascent polypeptide-associated complex protein [Candidatus ainarchaeum sp.]MDD4221428.1 nascent polypeptide-associated complex protein [Candidatus ainarchaeum sp.]MDD4662987.1 nascent polypeptide-associated complex protein [Candidatus ainarchaeum sp.]
MIPGMGGLDPRRINSMMKQMGIENKELSAKRVIIELEGDSKIVINNPSVTEISMQGQKTYQVAGEISEEKQLKIPEDDVNLVSTTAKVSYEKAKLTLEKTKGDIAQAISELEEK